jgi:carboxymethylenebutenolidase
MREYLAEEIALDHSDAILTRREAPRLGLLGLTATGAAALLAACGGDGGSSKQSRKPAGPTTSAAPAIAETVTFRGPQGDLQGAWAKASDPKGAVLVIHENRGLTDHIRSLPPRFAGDGYSALAIELLSEEGGTAAVGGEAEATAALGQAAPERLVADLRAGVDELGRRVNATRDSAVAGLAAAGLKHEVRTFPGVDHAFFNNTGPRYSAAAASEAYQAVLSWFGAHLA